MDAYDLSEGRTPLLVSMPHDGTEVPEWIAARMTDEARRLPDTDWHVSRLYDFAAALGATVLRARYSRYVVDLNRPPDGRALYPGASETELVPITCFDRSPVYRPGETPGPEEVAERVERYWKPYHGALERTLERLRAAHGIALLYDAHSIRSEVPRFFAGRLPDLNLGTAGGASSAADLRDRLANVLAGASRFTHAVDDRFKGGYITRRYGRPGEAVHAVQLELSQATYMEEAYPYRYREDLAERVRPVLRALIERALEWAAAGMHAAPPRPDGEP